MPDRRRFPSSSPLAALSDADAALIAQAPPPAGSQAMKAMLTKERFSDPAWIFERKLDGIRCIAIRDDGGAVKLRSRNDLSLNERYPEVAAALQGERNERVALDGEVVAFAGSATSFARLARRQQHRVPVFYYVFDLLWLDGYDIGRLPLRIRKRLLHAAVRFNGPIRLTPHRNEAGEAMFAHACKQGWEGVIAKRADSPYTHGRSRDWLKFKCGQGQELVIGGYTAPQGSRTEFGALLLGYYEDGRLKYAGKVGTGFDQETLKQLGGQLRELHASAPAFDDATAIRERNITWVQPTLVAQVAFSEWTGAGRLRHPSFLGLRDDKPASEVVRER
jgi:DNA ligase D-like protein (predicted ligase)